MVVVAVVLVPAVVVMVVVVAAAVVVVVAIAVIQWQQPKQRLMTANSSQQFHVARPQTHYHKTWAKAKSPHPTLKQADSQGTCPTKSQ